MSDKVSLIISVSTGVGESKKQRTVTNVSASATDNQLYLFSQAYVGLSTDSFEGAAKVTRRELEYTETPEQS